MGKTGLWAPCSAWINMLDANAGVGRLSVDPNIPTKRMDTNAPL